MVHIITQINNHYTVDINHSSFEEQCSTPEP